MIPGKAVFADDFVHFFHFDERYCGAIPQSEIRRVAVVEDQITCPECRANIENEWPEIVG